MKNLVAIVSLVVLASAACSQSSPVVNDTKSESTSADLQGVPYDKLVGRWQFVYDDVRRAAVETQLTTEISDPQQLARAKREAVEEAAASEIEFTKERLFVSRIGNKELVRMPCDQAPPGVTLALRDDRTLVMHDPRKGDLLFSRR